LALLKGQEHSKERESTMYVERERERERETRGGVLSILKYVGTSGTFPFGSSAT